MTSDLFPVVPKRQPALPLRTTDEARFWGRFQVKENFHLTASVTHVCFAPLAPHDLAITASAKVTVVDGRSNRISRTLGSFKDTAYSASFKKDGRLLVAGCENGSVQVFDVQRRATLRTLHGHSR